MQNSIHIFSRFIKIWSVLVFLMVFLTGCSSVPKNPNNICEIFREREKWYKSAYIAYQKWQVPISVMMAIMYQESGFKAEAKPPRTTCLFIFPGPRLSSAYGYSQALDSTWEDYQKATDDWGADRDDFSDAIDFIGWYCYQSYIQCGISRKDAYNLYLAYHEGQRGFREGRYQGKPRVKQIARLVEKRNDTYARQLAYCEWEFQRPGGCCLWPF